MAASGLNPTKEIKSDDPLTVRWKHLDMLVEFALELKKALQGINEQSFNHFVLKMGINHGPITAGVIGARKPHYGNYSINLLLHSLTHLCFIFFSFSFCSHRYMGKYCECSQSYGKYW